MVNKFLNAALESYPPKLEGRLIHPISKEDVEIIIEIGQILKKCGLDDVKAIWDNYKYLKDTEIRDQLLDWNTKHPVLQKEESEKEEKKTKGFQFLFVRDFIKFADERFELYYIKTWKKKDEFSFVNRRMEFWIIINEVPESITNLCGIIPNKRIKYLDMESRDRDFQLLDNYMSSHKSINFINQ